MTTCVRSVSCSALRLPDESYLAVLAHQRVGCYPTHLQASGLLELQPLLLSCHGPNHIRLEADDHSVSGKLLQGGVSIRGRTRSMGTADLESSRQLARKLATQQARPFF